MRVCVRARVYACECVCLRACVFARARVCVRAFVCILLLTNIEASLYNVQQHRDWFKTYI